MVCKGGPRPPDDAVLGGKVWGTPGLKKKLQCDPGALVQFPSAFLHSEIEADVFCDEAADAHRGAFWSWSPPPPGRVYRCLWECWAGIKHTTGWKPIKWPDLPLSHFFPAVFLPSGGEAMELLAEWNMEYISIIQSLGPDLCAPRSPIIEWEQWGCVSHQWRSHTHTRTHTHFI